MVAATAVCKPIGTLYYVPDTVYKAEKALIAAKFTGVKLNTVKWDHAKDAKKPDFLAKNPTGKVPYLETDMGVLFSSNSIAKYVARCRADIPLYGQSFDEEALIDSWLEFCIHELEVPMMTLVYPVFGLLEHQDGIATQARADLGKALAKLEARLKTSEYLVGEQVTLADVAIVCALRDGLTRVLDAAFRKPYPKTVAWFEKCCKIPQFQDVIGDVKLCTTPEKPKPVPVAAKKVAPAAPAPAAKGKAAAAPAKPAAAAPAATGGAVDEAAVTAMGDEIRKLKEKLKAEGLSGKKINDHDEVKALVAKLQELKAGVAAAPAPATRAAPAAAPVTATGGADAVTALGDEIRKLKEKLKAEGLSGKKINDHEEVKAMVAKLQELKAAAAAPAPAAAPPAAAPAAGGDAVTVIGDKIRTLKEKLKGEGLSGKKINEHAEVKALVAELQEAKAKAGQ